MTDLEDLKAELRRLHKLFDDAGEGQYNVLALLEHYQRSALEAEERARSARAEVAREIADWLIELAPQHRGSHVTAEQALDAAGLRIREGRYRKETP